MIFPKQDLGDWRSDWEAIRPVVSILLFIGVVLAVPFVWPAVPWSVIALVLVIALAVAALDDYRSSSFRVGFWGSLKLRGR